MRHDVVRPSCPGTQRGILPANGIVPLAGRRPGGRRVAAVGRVAGGTPRPIAATTPHQLGNRSGDVAGPARAMRGLYASALTHPPARLRYPGRRQGERRQRLLHPPAIPCSRRQLCGKTKTEPATAAVEPRGCVAHSQPCGPARAATASDMPRLRVMPPAESAIALAWASMARRSAAVVAAGIGTLAPPVNMGGFASLRMTRRGHPAPSLGFGHPWTERQSGGSLRSRAVKD